MIGLIARFAMASVVLLPAGFCAGDNKKGDKKDDKDLLQGEWQVVSTELRGKNVEKNKDRKVVVKGDEWAYLGGELKFKFRIDATKKPKQLDLTRSLQFGKKTWAGIYKIEGDTLTFCRSAEAGGERPTEFKGGPAVALIVFKRARK